MILGAIIGDVVGSIYESDNIKTKDFPLTSKHSIPTDESFMTMAIAHALMKWKKGSRIDESEFQQAVTSSMLKFGRRYIDAGYGRKFRAWLNSRIPKPYGSWGNGSAMRVSPVAWYFEDLPSVEKYADRVARGRSVFPFPRG